ncbi:hypothetical protein PR048_032604 [Dryococelus australis]|uniref:BED-type domain-containing protein n=1 Tax=Dryococelus australis TaxID=614101 RepID=A0ABQ9G5U2_9NEOP|nr:hypothetical protein PR048_032604 [Dryococelus australis]
MEDNKRRKCSEMWTFFTEINSEYASCNTCKDILSYKTSTSNLGKHMKHKHPTIELPTNSKNTEVTFELSLAAPPNLPSTSTSSQRHSSAAFTGGEGGTANSRLPETNRKLQNICRGKCQLKSRKQIDNKLLKMFTKDQPFSIVEDEGFMEFVAALNSSYNLPSRHTVAKTDSCPV